MKISSTSQYDLCQAVSRSCCGRRDRIRPARTKHLLPGARGLVTVGGPDWPVPAPGCPCASPDSPSSPWAPAWRRPRWRRQCGRASRPARRPRSPPASSGPCAPCRPPRGCGASGAESPRVGVRVASPKVEMMFKVLPVRSFTHGKRCGSAFTQRLVGGFAVLPASKPQDNQMQVFCRAPWMVSSTVVKSNWPSCGSISSQVMTARTVLRFRCASWGQIGSM